MHCIGFRFLHPAVVPKTTALYFVIHREAFPNSPKRFAFISRVVAKRQLRSTKPVLRCCLKWLLGVIKERFGVFRDLVSRFALSASWVLRIISA